MVHTKEAWRQTHPQSQKLVQKTCILLLAVLHFGKENLFLASPVGLALVCFCLPRLKYYWTHQLCCSFLCSVALTHNLCNTAVKWPILFLLVWSLFLFMLIYIIWLTWFKKTKCLLNSYQLNWNIFYNIIY